MGNSPGTEGYGPFNTIFLSILLYLTIKNSCPELWKEEEQLNIDSTDSKEHGNTLNNSEVTTTTVEEVSTNLEKPKSDADAPINYRLFF